MKMKRFAAIASAIGAIGALAAPAASAGPPNFHPAQAVCAAAGDTTFIVDPGEVGYACIGVPNPTQGQFASGQAVCEHAYGGTFLQRPSGYICVLTPV